MKKIFLAIIIIGCLSINSYNAYNKSNCINEIIPSGLNSKNILSYLSENNLVGMVNKICSKDICVSLNSTDIERDIKYFVDKNISYLNSKNSDAAIEAELKGFKIDKLIIYSC